MKKFVYFLFLTLIIIQCHLICKTEAKRRKPRGKKSGGASKQGPPKNCYEKLEVPTDSPERIIKRQFRKLAAKYHPDKIKDENEKKKAEEKFKELASCYESYDQCCQNKIK